MTFLSQHVSNVFLQISFLLLAVAPLAGRAQDGPAQEVFAGKSEGAPVVVVLSGQSGPPNYRKFAKQVADLGYYTVLVDGKDILTRAQDGAQNLRSVVTKAQAAPGGSPDKAMMIGFSQGGGGVLAHAVAMPDLLKAAVVYYPATAWSRNLPGLVSRIQIPLLILAGERDRYNNCCLVESMREIESLARERNIPLELVVYPNADHGFNLDGRAYRSDDTADAWRRTVEMLNRYHPVK